MDYTPKKITEIPELVENCFTRSGTCYLLLSSHEDHLKAVTGINQRLKAKKGLRLYITDLFVGKENMFGTDEVPAIIALNGKRAWYKKFEGEVTEENVAAWMDAVKMGEGKKVVVAQEMLDYLGREKGTRSLSTSTETTSIDSEDNGSQSTPLSTEIFVGDSTTKTHITSTKLEPQTTPVSVEGVKEVFGDQNENVHDEL